MKAAERSQPFSPDALQAFLNDAARVETAKTLHVTDGSSERLFYCVKGGVRALSVGPRCGAGLMGTLVESQEIPIDLLHEILEEQRTLRSSLRDVLITKEVLTREEYDDLTARLVCDDLCELVFWKGARYRIDEGQPPKELFRGDREVLQATVDTKKLARDVTKWLSRWRKLRHIVRDDTVGVTVTFGGKKSSRQEPPEVQRLLSLCGERIQVGQLWRRSGMPLTELYESIVSLAERKMVTLSHERAQRMTPEIEIATLEDSLRHLVEKDSARERLASLYRKTHQYEKAAAQLEELARSAAVAKNWSVATRRYKEALSLQPENVTAFEQCVEAYVNNGVLAELKQLAVNHLQVLSEKGLEETVDDCVRILEEVRGMETAVLEIRASQLAQRGEIKEAAHEYLRVAKLLQDRGETGHATLLLKQAVALDQGNMVAHRLLQEYGQEAEKKAAKTSAAAPHSSSSAPNSGSKRSRRRSRFRLLSTAALLAVLGILLYLGGFLDRWLPPALATASAETTAENEGNWFKRTISVVANSLRPSAPPPGNISSPINEELGLPSDYLIDVPAEGAGGLDPRSLFAPLAEAGSESGAIGELLISSMQRSTDEPAEETLESISITHDGPRDEQRTAELLALLTRTDARQTATADDSAVAAELSGESMPIDSRGSTQPQWVPRPQTQPKSSAPQTSTPQTSADTPLNPSLGRRLRRIVERTEEECLSLSVLTRRRLDSDTFMLYGDSCGAYIQDSSGRVLREFPRRSGTSWSIGHRAEVVCRWRPGGAATIFRRDVESAEHLTWRIPPEVDAVAVDGDALLLRENKLTALFRFDGTPVTSAELPRWSEGVRVGDTWVLSRRLKSGEYAVWVVEEGQLSVQWFLFEENGLLSVQ